MSNESKNNFDLTDISQNLKNDPERGDHLPTMPDPVHDPERGQRLPADPDPSERPRSIDDPSPLDEDESDEAPERVA